MRITVSKCWVMLDPEVQKYRFMVHLLLDWLDQQKNEYLCSILEAVPRLVISHMLQPVVRLLLRPATAASVFAVLLLLPPPQNSKSLLATTISLMSSSSSFISFPAIAPDLQQSALFRLLCVTGHSWRTVKPLWYECLIQWQQNGSKAMWQLYRIPAIRGCPRRFY